MSRKKVTEPPPDDFAPPAILSKELHPQWREVIADLQLIGAVSRTDIVMLIEAFSMLENARILQARFRGAAGDPATESLELGRLQSASASAVGSFLKLVGKVREMIAERPKPEKKDDWLARDTM
jgi:hypothetical protein